MTAFFPSTYPRSRSACRNAFVWFDRTAGERVLRNPIRGTFCGCWASVGWIETIRIAVTSQYDFLFIAAPIYGQWICHSPNPMKTVIFVGTTGSESGKSTRGEYQI